MKPETRNQKPSSRATRSEETRNILLIRLSALGDVAMLIPVLRVFEASYPEVKLTVLSKPFHKPLFDEFQNVNFFPADVKGGHKGLTGLYKLSKELKSHNITAVADVHNVLLSKILGSFLSLKGIKTAKINKGRTEKKALTRAENKDFKPLKTTVERYVEVFEKLGFPLDMSTHVFPVKKEIPAKAIPLIDATFKNKIGIAPFAAHEGKMYPLEMMEQLIARLDAENQTQLFLFGGGKKEEILLNQLAGKYSSVTNLAGTLSFEQELAIISNLDAMIAMDSGNAHLAAIYDVPTITIWGVTHPYAGFYPFNQPLENALLADREKFPLIPTSIYGNKFPKGYENAIKTITPQQILEKVKQVLL